VAIVLDAGGAGDYTNMVHRDLDDVALANLRAGEGVVTSHRILTNQFA
jgi:hypothetical protein